MTRRAPDAVALHDERVKLLAVSVVAIGVALLALALLRPVIDGALRGGGGGVFWGVVAVALHALARYRLGVLKTEVAHDDV